MTTKKRVKNKKENTKKSKEKDAITFDDKNVKLDDFLKSSEAEYLKYSPKNVKEEKELLLIKMIRQAEDRLDDNLAKIEHLKFELRKMEIEGEVHRKILAKNPKMLEQWQYNFMEDFYAREMSQFGETEDRIKYDLAWIEEAKKMITTQRYKNLPTDFFIFFHFDGEEIFPWEKEDFFDDDEMDDDGFPILRELEDLPF